MQFQPHDEYSKKIARLEKVCINDITSDSYPGIFSCYLAIVQTMYPFIIIFLHNMELLITIFQVHIPSTVALMTILPCMTLQ